MHRDVRKSARVAIVLVAAAVITAACGSDSTDSAGSGSGSAGQAVKVGFSLPSLDEYYSVVLKSAQDEAKSKGIDLLVGNGVSGADPTVQISKVQNLLAQGIKVLLISPQGEGLVPVLDRAVGQGVKVIFIDQQIPSWDKAVAFIGTDNGQGSTLMGDYLAKRLGGKGEVGVMVGAPGIPVSVARTTNLKNVLEKSGVTVSLSSQADACQADQAVGVIKNFLTSHPNVDAMFSICGPTGLAVDQVLSERKGGKPVLSTSWDVFVEQINHILDGTQTAAVAQFPVKLAQLSLDNALATVDGKTIPKVIDTGTELVTKDNADKFFHEGSSGYAYLLQN
jgi:ABC-type sugar transport system substrate-binding protein